MKSVSYEFRMNGGDYQKKAYFNVFGRRQCKDLTDNVLNNQSDSVQARGIASFGGTGPDLLACLGSLVLVAAGNRVYNVQRAQLVRGRSLFNVRIEVLNEYGLGLFFFFLSLVQISVEGWRKINTWTFSKARSVNLRILEPDTPGGLTDKRASKVLENS